MTSARPEQLTAEIHQLRNGSAVADELHDLRADQRHGFGIVQPNAAREPLLREIAGLMQCELVELVRCQMHEVTIFCSRDRRLRAATERRDASEAHARPVRRWSRPCAPTRRHREAMRPTRQDPLREESEIAKHAFTISAAAAATSGPVMTAVNNTSTRPIRSATLLKIRLEDDRIEENPAPIASDVDTVFIARKCPSLARCVAT